MPPTDAPQLPQPDLTACDREPIHVPGGIQPHGVLLVVDGSGSQVLHASDNCAGHLGADAADLIGRPLDAALGADAGLLRSKLGAAPADHNPARLLTLAAPVGGVGLHVLAHRRGDRVLLELEPAAGDAAPADAASGETASDETASGEAVHAQVLASALRLGAETSVVGLLDAAAGEVRRLSGFDRVMVYRFDPDGHGEVVAEDRADDWHSYLGHHFPASDIPRQARALYLLNRVRLVPDAGYRPAMVLPPDDPETGRPLDLSYSALRSVSPVHVEYLKNMGVAASMSVSVVVEGRLWGLIACHHRTPRFVSYDVRSGCDHLGRVVAARLAANQRAEERDHRLALTALQARLLERMAGHADYADGLIESPRDLMELAAANAVAVRAGDRLHLLGETPARPDVVGLLDWLAATGRAEVYATDALAREYPPAGAWAGAAGGILAVGLGPSRQDCIVWFRPEVVRSVVWAGDPDKPAAPTDPLGRIHPRRSFEAWTQVVRHRSPPWEPRHVDAAAAFRAAITGIVFRKADELARERQRRAEAEASNRAKDRHVAFLAHELRGPLTPALLAAAAMAADAGLPPPARADAAMIRRNIELATRLADDLLDAHRIALGKLELRVGTVDVHETIRAALGMCGAEAATKGVRLVPDLRAARPVARADAPKLTQVWTNLLKNAVKFTPAPGTILVRTSDATNGLLRVEVRDTGAGVEAALLPAMFNLYEQGDRSVTREHAGLGLGLPICKGIVEAHGGTITAFSEGAGRGTTMTVELPATAAQPAARPAHPTSPASPTPDSPGGQDPAGGLKILLVDDHEDTLRVMSRLLGGLKHHVTTATGVGTALSAAGRDEFDLLISDVGLADGSGLDLMRELHKLRPIRGIALTGYGTASDVEATRAAGFVAHMTKPVNLDRLQALILDVGT